MPKYYSGVLSSNEYGNRLIIKKGPLNPRDKLGKFGITTHNWFTSLFYETINIKFTTGFDSKGKPITKTFRLNRNSLIKYVRAADPQSTINAQSSQKRILQNFKRQIT